MARGWCAGFPQPSYVICFVLSTFCCWPCWFGACASRFREGAQVMGWRMPSNLSLYGWFILWPWTSKRKWSMEALGENWEKWFAHWGKSYQCWIVFPLKMLGTFWNKDVSTWWERGIAVLDKSIFWRPCKVPGKMSNMKEIALDVGAGGIQIKVGSIAREK